MADVYSDFLDELLANIRARPISWEAQQRSGVIDEHEVRTIKTIDKQRRDKRIDLVAKVTCPYNVRLFIAGPNQIRSASCEPLGKRQKSRYSAIYIGDVG